MIKLNNSGDEMQKIDLFSTAKSHFQQRMHLKYISQLDAGLFRIVDGFLMFNLDMDMVTSRMLIQREAIRSFKDYSMS